MQFLARKFKSAKRWDFLDNFQSLCSWKSRFDFRLVKYFGSFLAKDNFVFLAYRQRNRFYGRLLSLAEEWCQKRMTSACCSNITIYPKLPFLMHTQQIYTLQNHLHFFLLMYHNHICNLRQLPINFKWSTASLINHFSRIFWFFQFAFFWYLKRTKENFNLTSKIHWSNGTF